MKTNKLKTLAHYFLLVFVILFSSCIDDNIDTVCNKPDFKFVNAAIICPPHSNYQIGWQTELENLGTVDSGTTVQAWLSNSDDPENPNKIASGGTVTGIVKANSIETTTVTFGATLSQSPTNFQYLILEIDHNKEKDECNEDNNFIVLEMPDYYPNDDCPRVPEIHINSEVIDVNVCESGSLIPFDIAWNGDQGTFELTDSLGDTEVTIDPNIGKISWTENTMFGDHILTITATNSVGSDTKTIILRKVLNIKMNGFEGTETQVNSNSGTSIAIELTNSGMANRYVYENGVELLMESGTYNIDGDDIFINLSGNSGTFSINGKIRCENNEPILEGYVYINGEKQEDRFVRVRQ